MIDGICFAHISRDLAVTVDGGEAGKTHSARLYQPFTGAVGIFSAYRAGDDLLDVCERLIGMTRSQRAALGPMHEGRVDVIGGGAIVIEELAIALRERAGIEELTVSEHDILDGIALSIAE